MKYEEPKEIVDINIEELIKWFKEYLKHDSMNIVEERKYFIDFIVYLIICKI